ncbi:chloride channel protein [Solimicrobium silvestre]|uniref:Chloride channel protein EriC n=1 Tax=Solimicrobium silvestre TaxID=2099400 RepID=A0A2S9GTQ2_9BURK|nr:chloride channel protein [Solimicrobium silvestre]PRC91104.1 Chloride channel protein EriC [Solimicrobium silvestre]
MIPEHSERLSARLLEIWHRGSAWIVGPVLVGLMAVGLALGSDQMSTFNMHLNKLHPYAPLLFMPLGFALLAYLGKRFVPGSQGSGIPQTIAATDAEENVNIGYLLSWRIAIGKALLTLGGIGLGASIGREGPTIQIGAAVMNSFHGRGPFQSVESRRILILAGGAAGIAAAFNTPLAGIMFAIEELSKKHVFNANSSTLVTIIGSGLISLSILGSYTYFGTTESFLDWNGSLGAILLCGIVGGAAGGLFSRLFILSTFHMPSRFAAFVKQRPILFAAVCGLIVAIIGVSCNGLIFGTGYQPTRLSLEDTASLPWYFGMAKLLATLLSSISGIAGGVFAPSLSVGAGIGDNVAALFPLMADHSAIVLLVMAAYLSGVTRAPVTSFVICMEMTNSHQMLLPLMAASVVASRISKFISPTPLYHKLAENFTEVPVQAAKQQKTRANAQTQFADRASRADEKFSSTIKKQPDIEVGRSKFQ